MNGCGRNETNTYLMGSMSFDRLEVRLMVKVREQDQKLDDKEH